MAMVTIQRGQHVVKVSRNAYDTMFKKKGYRIVGESAENKEPYEVGSENVEAEDEEIETIPISDMNSAELKEYAKKHNIDTSKAKNLTEARRIVQKAVRESKM